MNIFLSWIEHLSKAGHEAQHWSDIGDKAAKDTEIMQWARQNDFIVFTHDLDFSALLFATRAIKPSVIQLRSAQILPEHVGDIVLETLESISTQLLAGALVTVDPDKHRVRLLPLG